MAIIKEDQVVISRDEYESLMNKAAFLSCLDAAGVDNWDGYEWAQDAYTDECPFPDAD